MMNVYVSVAYWGSGDNKEFKIIYVGTAYFIAKQKLIDFVFPDNFNNWGMLEYWRNGIKIKEEIIRE